MKKSRFQHPVVRRLNHLWQAALVYALIGLFRILPLPAASNVGGWIGRTIGTRLGVTRRARRNLAYIFPEKSESEKDAIIREMWDNLGRVAAETPHAQTLVYSDYLTVDVSDALKDALKDGKPVMMVSGHFANWEILPIAMKRMGYPVATVYRRPNNPYVDFLIKRLRRDVTTALFAKGAEGARGMMRWLRDGKAVGMLLDQKMNEGVAMDFLGKPAMTGTVPAQLALTTGARVFPVSAVREEGCRFRITVLPMLETNPDAPREDRVMDLTQQINDYLGDHIRRHPGQWLWLHRRWIGV